MKKFLFLFCVSSSLMLAADVDMRSRLTVRGDSTLFKPADQLHLSVGVISQEDTAQAALQDNNTKMDAVIKALENAGLTKDEYQTGRFSIQPVWSQPPREPKESWTSVIVGYKVSNTLTIKSDKLNKAGTFIDAASKAGANSMDNISFGMKDSRAFRGEAIAAATANAISDARTLASSSQQKLGRVLDISLDEARPAPVMNRAPMMTFAKMNENASFASINPGDVEISASVLVVYEISP